MRFTTLTLIALLLFSCGLQARTGSLKGIVSASGGTFPGGVVVQVQVGSNTVGDIAEKNGSYSINPIPAGSYEVHFIAEGFGETTRKVQIVAGRVTSLNVTIRENEHPALASITSGARRPGGAKGDKRYRSMKHVSAEAVGMGMSARESVREEAADYGVMPSVSAAPASIDRDDEAAPDATYSLAKDSKESASIMPSASPAARAGTLTSGESNDFTKWKLWEDMAGPALKEHQKAWGIYPEQRYSVSVQTATGQPLNGARVRLLSGGTQIWEAWSDNTGRAELWAGINTGLPVAGTLRAEVNYGGSTYFIESLKPFGAAGVNTIRTKAPCTALTKLDIAFIVDATGSMQDEIDYLKAELSDILQKVSDSLPKLDVQTASLFYRDLGDEYVTVQSDFAPGIEKTLAFLRSHHAGGGGDFEEGVDMALDAALEGLAWREGTVAKIAFLVLDAPPHNDPVTAGRIRDLTAAYAAKGIRLVPVACSGVDKNTEYIMRSMALATNGTYLFLTDHSGIGDSHIAPTTDKFEVEYLNGLVYRVIYQFSYMPACKEAFPSATDTMQQQQIRDSATAIKWRYYPNPTSGRFTISYESLEGTFFITDITGKALLQLKGNGSGTVEVDLGQYPAGTYFIRYQYAHDRWLSGKVLVIR